MNTENEYSSINISRSKSYDDLSMIFENEADMSINNSRKSFSRQGAFRRRTQDIDIRLLKRTSLSECKNQIKSNLTLFIKDFENSLEKEKDRQKKPKNGFYSFTIVKDMWKSLKKDSRVLEKEEIKRKITEVNGHGSSGENDSSDVNGFLRKFGDKFSDMIDSPIILTESSWEELVDSSKTLTKQEADRQTAIWEIIETDSNFIKQLSIITHVFYPVLEQLITKYSTELSKVDIHDMFGNINELYVNHWTLWSNCISLPLSVSKIKRTPLDIMLMKDGFCKISKILESYISFMRSLPTMREKIRKLQNDCSIFNQYIEWTKAYCRLCRDGHMCVLSLPFQRITRYKILLERVKSLSSDEQQEDINEMIVSIHGFLQKMNSTIVGKYSMKDIKEKLVYNNTTREHMCDSNKFVNEDDFHFDIMRPIVGFPERLLIHEGRLKLKWCNNRSLDVHCYLCNDMIMICKPIKSNWDKLKIHKSPVRLDKLLVKEETEGSFSIIIYNDFRVIDNVMVLIGDVDEVKLWVEKCNNVIKTFMNKFAEHNGAILMSANYSYEVAMTIPEEDNSLDEYQRIWKYSETTSSIDSTYSTDSAFSQISSDSTQTDCCRSMSKTSLLQNTNHEKSLSIEDFAKINELHSELEIIRKIEFA